jgi:autotransporter-associated beta strand protein
VKAGDGTLTLGGVSTLDGTVSIQAGTVAIADDAALGDPSAVLRLAGGTLKFNADATIPASRQIDFQHPIGLEGDIDGGTIDTNGCNVNVFATISEPKGFLAKAGGGELRLFASAQYPGRRPSAAAGSFRFFPRSAVVR